MNVPRMFRKQFDVYERAGFHPVSFEFAKGAHVKVKFAEFPEVQVLTKNADEPRALKNNLARFRNLAEKAKATQ